MEYLLSMVILCNQVKRGTIPSVRPRVPRSLCDNTIVDLLEGCWSEEPAARPNFAKIQGILRAIPEFNRDNMLDHLFIRMEQYAATLEQQVSQIRHQEQEVFTRTPYSVRAVQLVHFFPSNVPGGREDETFHGRKATSGGNSFRIVTQVPF